ncbi:hypothetical protein OIU78_021128 [Salix suchowensis]|nr:hypothetical protein OIU78_021128 [Salix suchowensis]
MEFLSNNPCCSHGCASMHGRFGEITFQADESEDHITEGAPNILSQPEYSHYQEVWGQQESRQLVPMGSGRSHLDEQCDSFDQPIPEKNTNEKRMENGIPDGGKSFRHFTGSGSFSRPTSLYNDLADSNESEIQQDLRWLKAKHQMELRKLRDEQLGTCSETFSINFKEWRRDNNNSCALSDTQRHRNHKAMKRSPRPEDMVTAKNFCTGPLLPHSLHRTTSLPVDAVDV